MKRVAGAGTKTWGKGGVTLMRRTFGKDEKAAAVTVRRHYRVKREGVEQLAFIVRPRDESWRFSGIPGSANQVIMSFSRRVPETARKKVSRRRA